MSYVIAAPELMTSAATDVATIGSNVSAAHKLASTPTTSVMPAAADEVSAAIAQLFSQHAVDYQALAGKAAAFNDQFVQHLNAGAFSYTDIEAAITASLQSAEQAFISSLISFTEIPLVQNILIGLAVAGIAVLLTALYLYVASSAFLTSGQILTPGVFLLGLALLSAPLHWGPPGGPLVF